MTEPTNAPTVKVTNAESTTLPLTCKPPQITDAANPLYKLEASNTVIDLPAGKATVTMDLPENRHYDTTGKCTFQCDGQYQEIIVTADGVSGTGYAVMLPILVTSTINGYALDIELSAEPSCKVSW